MNWLFFDFETFGTDTRRDWPAQFAAIRTDENFNTIEEYNLFCQVPLDQLPAPEACLVTGLSPQDVNAKGIPEYRFAAEIFSIMTQEPDTVLCGYNIIGFDRPLTRQIFYRNFFDPYRAEWQKGNSYFDLFPLVRLQQAIRPDGFIWPEKEEGGVDLRLSSLVEANGLEQPRAHDALSDVMATIDLARHLKKAQPRLFEYMFSIRKKRSAEKALIDFENRPFVFSSGFIGRDRHYTTVVCKVAEVGTEVVVADLCRSSEWTELSVSALQQWWLSPTEEQKQNRIPLYRLRANAAPVVAPLGVLSDKNREQLGIDLDKVKACWDAIQMQTDLPAKISSCLIRESTPSADAELALYDAFLSDEDRAASHLYHQADEHAPWPAEKEFFDERLPVLVARGRARHWPELISNTEHQEWVSYCQKRLIQGDHPMTNRSYAEYQQEITDLTKTYAEDSDKISLLRQLQEWGELLLQHATQPTEP